MARPINYLFCTYEIEIEDEVLSGEGEFSLISENQGGEHRHGREKEGIQPQTLCTDPKSQTVEDFRSHSFEIGYKPGVRVRQEYDGDRREVVKRFERDTHTKFGHVVTVPSLRAMAIRDRASDDTIAALQTIGAMKSFIRGVSDGLGQINISHASDEDVSHALEHWDVHEYSYTIRPLNPTGGDLARRRSEMFERENVFQESGRVIAPPGESLRVADGVIGEANDLVASGYGQEGLKGKTEDGNSASIPKLSFSQDKNENLRWRESKPRFLRVSFERESIEDDKTLEVASSLVRFYRRDEPAS